MATPAMPTPQQPPNQPNFYEQAAKGTPAAPAKSNDDMEFREAVTKLLSVFAKMEKLKPNGMDITKDMQAMADVLKNCVERVEGKQSSANPEGGAAPAQTPTPAA